MTNREYISQRLAGFNVSEALLADSGIDPDSEYVPSETMDRAVVSLLEELILAPSIKSVSESGFSVSWDTERVGRWYLYLCNKYGIAPDDDVLPLLGISMIKDISDLW